MFYSVSNLWTILDQNVRQLQISNKNYLIAALKEEWAKITRQTTREFVESMQKSLKG